MLRKFIVICPICYHTTEHYCNDEYPNPKFICNNCEGSLLGWDEINPNLSDTIAHDLDEQLTNEVFNGYPKGHKCCDDKVTGDG